MSVRDFFSVKGLQPRSGAIGTLPSTAQVYKDVVKIALPSVAEMVLMSLISAIDTKMVGTIGYEAIAAVGLVAQPRMLTLSIFFALNIGVTAIVARRKGEDRQADANRTLRNAIFLVVALAIAITGVMLALSKPFMYLAGAEPETVDAANTYFRILTAFLPVNALTMCLCAAQRGVGNTRITMYVNTASNLVNVVFNYLLIGGNFGFPRLGVAGAAYATVIGYCVGFFLSLTTLFGGRKHNQFLYVSRHDDWRIDKDTMRSIARMGGNAALEQLALRFGFFAYARIVAGLGTPAFAAHQVAMQFLIISFNFGDGIGVAGTSLVGQMLGRKRPDLAHIYGKAAQRIALVVSILLASSIALSRGYLVSLFTQDAYVSMLAAKVMLIVAVFQPFQTSSVVISGALRGAGDNRYVAKIMLLCVAIIRPLSAFIAIWVLERVFKQTDILLVGVWAASLIDMVMRMTLMIRRFNGGKWHGIKV